MKGITTMHCSVSDDFRRNVCLHLRAWLRLFRLWRKFLWALSLRFLPYCDIFILGWTVPKIAGKRLVANQKTSRHEGIKMNICFSLTGHICVFRQSWGEFDWVTVITRTWRTRSDERHSQNRSAVRPKLSPTPQTYKYPVSVAKYSRDQCQTHFMSDFWTQLRLVDDYLIRSSHIHSSRVHVLRQDV